MNTATAFQTMPTAEVVEQPKETALAVIPEERALEVFLEGKGIDELLAACEEKATAITADVSTAKGRAEIKSMAYLVTRTKTAIDAVRKALADEYKEKPKRIDANGKRIKDFLDALQERVRKPLTDWEETEKARVQGIKDRIAVLSSLANAANGTPKEVIMAAITAAEITHIDDSFGEFATDAAKEKDRVLSVLRPALLAREKYEAEQSELKRLREEAAKREQEERDRKIAEAAAEKARREVEEKAAREKAEAERKAKEEREAAERRELELKLDAERAERERLQAIERAEREKQAAIEAERRKQEEAERARLAEEARARAEAERRAADLANRERVHVEIRDMLMSEGLPQTYAAAVVSLLSEGRVPHCVVRY